MNKFPIPRKAIPGLSLIYVAGLAWIVELFIPFSNLPHKWWWFTAILIAAELCFMAGVALLGKTYWQELKAKYLSWLTNRSR